MAALLSFLSAFLGELLKALIEDGLSGNIIRKPTPVITADPDPSIDQQAQNVVDQWDKQNP